ncbi:MAG TPA: hypothetical protein VF268_08195 [Gammaproteobacteria bacterium]
MRLLTIFFAFFVLQLQAYASTLVSGLPPSTLYSEEQELFILDFTGVSVEDSSTGQVTHDAVTDLRNGYNPNLNGQLYFYTTGKHLGYGSSPGMANTTEEFNILVDLVGGITIWPDYTMNVLPFSSLIQLLDVPTFDMSTTSGVANFMISSFDGATGSAIAWQDLMGIDIVDSGIYAPLKGTVQPHVSGRPDIFTYIANPGQSGWDSILAFVRAKNGKMGYNFFYIYIP